MKKVGFPVLLMAVGIGISIFFIYLFTEVAEEVLEQEVKAFDDAILSFFKHFETNGLDQFMIFVTELGSLWFLALFTIATIIALWVRNKDKWGILFFIAAIGGGGLLTKVLKFYYERGRPAINEDIDAVGYSFPSGHSMGSLIFYGFLTYFIIRSETRKGVKWFTATVAVLLVVLIGISRIYLDAHYPSDVIAGHLAGAIWLILCILALEWVVWQHATSIRPLKSIRKFLKQLY